MMEWWILSSKFTYHEEIKESKLSHQRNLANNHEEIKENQRK